jgi:CMP/dCMP kinase
VRAVLRERQRALAAEGRAVMEGRDIGAVVCPGADVKVFLTADADERARRRTDERPGLGADALATDLRLRDARDAAQMEPAPDATTIDTTALTIDQVVARIEDLAAAKART